MLINVKPDYLYSGSVSFTAMVDVTYPQCLAATHLTSPEVGNKLSWPKP